MTRNQAIKIAAKDWASRTSPLRCWDEEDEKAFDRVVRRLMKTTTRTKPTTKRRRTR